MSLLTRIVKSSSVVDGRSQRETPANAAELLIGTQTVLKKHLIEHGVPAAAYNDPYSKQGLADELNRLRIEIEVAKKELRHLNRETDQARQEMEDGEYPEADEAKREDPDEAAEAIIRTAEEKAESMSREILEIAREEASDIIGKAKVQGAEMAEQARNEGYLEGFSKGYEEATQEFRSVNDPKSRQIAEILNRLENYQQKLAKEEEENLILVATALAAKILRRTISEDPTAVVDMLCEVVERNSHEEFIKITLAADLLPIQAQASEEVRAMLEKLGANVTVVTDSGMPVGGAKVETPKGLVDVSIETQLDKLKATMLTD